MMRTKPPTRGEIAARPTISSEDRFAERGIRQTTSEHQQQPHGDNRYRVDTSAKFYVVQLMGEWVNVSESAERVVRSRNNLRWVTFETKEYELRRADKFKSFLRRFIQGGCYAYIGGKQVDGERGLKSIDPFPFIYIASSESVRTFNAMWAVRKLAKKRM